MKNSLEEKLDEHMESDRVCKREGTEGEKKELQMLSSQIGGKKRVWLGLTGTGT